MDKRKDTNIHAGNKIYRDQLVTLGDLQDFKDDLILSIRAMIQANASQPMKKWLKSYEVVKLLNISKGTLQTLRNNGTLPFTKIGHMIYYDQDEINNLMADKKKKFVGQLGSRQDKLNRQF